MPGEYLPKRESGMSKLVRIVVQLPVELKEQLDILKHEGYTTSGFIRATLERELNKRKHGRILS